MCLIDNNNTALLYQLTIAHLCLGVIFRKLKKQMPKLIPCVFHSFKKNI